LNSDGFYESVLRYHERLLGTGLPQSYLDELVRDDIDGKVEKLARITCGYFDWRKTRFRCVWSSNLSAKKGPGCTEASEQAVSVFWYPEIVAWVCPTIIDTCSANLSRCFISHENQAEAQNAELGTTEAFDSRFAVIRSLSRQAAGLAAAVVTENYPYTKVLEPGLTAVDGALAHLLSQTHHFKVSQLNLAPELIDLVQSHTFKNTRYHLVNTGYDYSSGGVISTFGFLRRYEKNRTRGNELYRRLLCREFTADLPKVFPQDPGNLRVAPGCSGCHATLDPLADFFLSWGEGGELYQGEKASVTTTFNNKTGTSVADLAEILRGDRAFATCTVQNVWTWLMGRKFYRDEEALRTALTDYLIKTRYSFRELVYAITTHPLFLEGTRSDGIVGDPLQAPPLGEIPTTPLSCDRPYTYADDIAPKIHLCTSCHSNSTRRQSLVSEGDWQTWGETAVQMMASGQMPPGPSTSEIVAFKDAVTCWLRQNP
jgi:hypothetical protein